MDPTTDIAAANAVYPATIKAVKLLGKDTDLVGTCRRFYLKSVLF